MKNWDDVYRLPLRADRHGSGWVYDDNDNFVFQFEIENPEIESLILDLINGNQILVVQKFAIFNAGITMEGIRISINGKLIITIRGWGNLTSKSGHNLPGPIAANIQDTFAEFILSKLTIK